MTLAKIYELITSSKGSFILEEHRRIVGLLVARADSAQQLSSSEGELAKKIMAESGYIECSWSLIIGGLLWRSGYRTFDDFSNMWNCARFSGVSSRFSRLNTAEHLEIAQNLKAKHPSPAAFILLGNAQRGLYRYSNAEDAYLEGIHRFPDDPFIKFRLVDLHLATYKLHQAHQLLNNLKPLYPYAREMMFISPNDTKLSVPENFIPPLSAGSKGLVCFVAADPVYTQRYAINFARSVQNCTGNEVHFHFHLICDTGTRVSPNIYAELNNIIDNPVFTERNIDVASAGPEWRKALFASERFLFLAEILRKYQKPVLVTDIDVECLKDPMELLPRLENGDFGYTNFKNTLEAWERYAATVMLVKPTEASITFFRNMAMMLMSVLGKHSQPWFADQIVLFRLIEEFPSFARSIFLQNILTDSSPPSPQGYFRILHGSWE